MNWAGLNWETILVASIPGVIVLLGAIYNDIRRRRNAHVDTQARVSEKREPSWVELENANRQLREELTEQRADYESRINALDAKITEYQRKTNKRISALSNMLHESARQWPATHPGPLFDPEDLAALENTDIPYIWKNRVRPRTVSP